MFLKNYKFTKRWINVWEYRQQNKTTWRYLKVELKKGSKVIIASFCFSIYAFKELKEELSQIEELKFLFTSPTLTKVHLAEETKKEKGEFFIPK